MKRILLFAVVTFFLFGCKKAKENIIREAASSFLDGTEWKVVAFADGTSNLDAAFQPYRFRFNRDATVNAIRNSSNATEASGTYSANVLNRTIQAQFATGTVHPLPLLSTTWTITQNTMSSLTATATVGGTERRLRMEKL